VSNTSPLPPNPMDSTHDGLVAVPVPPRGDDLLTVRSAFSDGTYVIALYGELDLSTVAEVRRHILRAEATSAAEIVIDLSAVHFMDSTGITLLHEAHRRSQADGNRLRLLRGPAEVQRALEICGLDRQLPFLG
jgi:anti-sigma B factor antagonist